VPFVPDVIELVCVKLPIVLLSTKKLPDELVLIPIKNNRL